jgi:membrane-bound lytic murein transglycosylase A
VTVTSKPPSLGRKSIKFCVVALLTVAAGCAQIDPGKRPNDSLVFLDTDMESLPGWSNDKVLNALPALQKSCRMVLRRLNRRNKSQETVKKYSDWQQSCDQITANNFNENTFREFLKRTFNAYQISYLGSDEGLFTGYYEPTIYGSLKPSREYKTPIYPKPTDLIHVNLGEWKSSFESSHIVGRVVGNKLKPYFSRSDISKGALDGKTSPLLWLKSEIDAFFLHIQGSGRVVLPDGEVYRLGYAGKNGRRYYSIGRYLIEIGAIPKENISMQSIKTWLKENPEKKKDVMNMNPSYVFFRKLKGKEGPIGSQGVVLTSGRSLAVDRRYSQLGAPIWLSANFDDENGKKLQRLMVAQDTGGAIKGPIRGDVFWGSGEIAEQLAGTMKAKGSIYVFYPKSINPNYISR